MSALILKVVILLFSKLSERALGLFIKLFKRVLGLFIFIKLFERVLGLFKSPSLY